MSEVTLYETGLTHEMWVLLEPHKISKSSVHMRSFVEVSQGSFWGEKVVVGAIWQLLVQVSWKNLGNRLLRYPHEGPSKGREAKGRNVGLVISSCG